MRLDISSDSLFFQQLSAEQRISLADWVSDNGLDIPAISRLIVDTEDDSAEVTTLDKKRETVKIVQTGKLISVLLMGTASA